VSGALGKIRKNIEKVILGKEIAVDHVLLSMICRGHILIEDVPGLGKTMLARSLARSIDCETQRLQFTPDMLPSDITGISLFDQTQQAFRFIPGPVFTNILLADEINRTSPRTQSALLEAMEERQVSIDGHPRALPDLFMVIATQNQIEQAGTYALPEAQMDRFFMRISMGYPSEIAEVSIINAQQNQHPIHTLQAVASEAEVLEISQKVNQITLEDSLKRYIVDICAATRNHPLVKLGASPRGSLALARASQGMALMKNSDYVDPNIIKKLVMPVLAHRLMLNYEARSKSVTSTEVLEDILKKIKVPVT